VVGERWALLVVRELLLGPQRFSDLRRALPNAASNVIADRLRELEGRGAITRRTLPPPAGSSVYELTAWGRGLESIVLALGNWGIGIPLPPTPVTLAVWVDDGQMRVQAGEPNMPDVSLRTDPWTLNTLLDDPSKLDLAVSKGSAAVTGEWSVLRRLLDAVVTPAPAAL
jgi:DNA-binding HxlR family transcriptional regulator